MRKDMKKSMWIRNERNERERIYLYVTKEDKKFIKEEADKAGVSVSKWVGDKILESDSKSNV